MTLSEEIKRFFKGDVDASPKTLEAYARDASLFYVRPALVVYPKDSGDIQRLVSFAASERKNGRNITLTPRSGGTDMGGGPLTESVVVDMTRGFSILKGISGNLATVQPGMYYRDFEKKTLQQELLMPSYPASREICTVGGMVANNSGGEKTLRYGKTEKYIQNIKMVLADGKEYSFSPLTESELRKKESEPTFEGGIYKKIHSLLSENKELLARAKPSVTKNSSGYYLWNVYDSASHTFDMTKLIVGSQGTLGIITEITFKLIRPNTASRLLVIFLKDMGSLGEISARILSHHPESFESYDNNTFRLALRFFPEILERIKGNLLRLAISFIPEAWLLVTGGIPKLVLLAEFTADTVAEAEAKAEAAKKDLEKTFRLKMRVTKTKEETEEFWVIRRESFNLLRHHVRGLRTAPFIDDTSVPAATIPEFLPKLYEILGQYKLIYTIAGHIGDGNFHIIPLMNLADPKVKDIIVELSKKVYDLVLQYRGSTTGEHNDGLIRTPFLKQVYGDAVYRLFEETKHIFDPDELFNPGKKVGGSMEYTLGHIDTKM